MRKFEKSLHSLKILFNEVCQNESLHDQGKEDQRTIGIFLNKMETYDMFFHWVAVILGVFVLLITHFLFGFLLYFFLLFLALKVRMFLYKRVIVYLRKKYFISSVLLWMRVYTRIYPSRFGLIEI